MLGALGLRQTNQPVHVEVPPKGVVGDEMILVNLYKRTDLNGFVVKPKKWHPDKVRWEVTWSTRFSYNKLEEQWAYVRCENLKSIGEFHVDAFMWMLQRRTL